MQINPLLIVVLTGLFAAYLWRENKILSRHMARLTQEASTQESSRRYKEIFDNGSDAVFVVEVLHRGKFRFESLNQAAVLAICPQGTDLGDYRFDETAKFGNDAGLAFILAELAGQLRRCLATGLPAEYESAFRVSADGGGQKNYHIKLIPMADDGGISHILCFAQDITAHKLYELELLERIKLEERLSGFAASAPGFFYTYRHGMDGSNAMPFASAGIGDIFGLRPDDVAKSIGTMNLLIHLDDMSGVIGATAASAANLSPFAVEFRVHHPEKGELWVESRAMPVLEADGSIQWHGFMHDITGRKHADQELALLNCAINLGDPVFMLGNERIIYANQTTCRMLEYKADEIIGLTVFDIDPDISEEQIERSRKMLAERGSHTFESRHKSKTGRIFPVEVSITLVPYEGREFVLSVARDITERKCMEASLRQNQERLAEAQRIGQMGSWELNLASGVLIWSDEIYRIFEIDPALFGASCEAFLNAIHPDDRETVNNAYTESLEDCTPYCIDHRLLFADGRIKHVRECCETHYDDNGKPLYSRGTVQDITVLKETERQLKETQSKLRELVISRESLIEGERKRIAWEMHEELGQLLAAMNLRVYSMRSQLPGIPLLDENSRIIVGLIDKSIKTVREIVSELRPTALLHGTVAALEWLVAEFNKHPDMVCKLELDEDGTPVSDELTTLVFRIVQESLENIVRRTGVSSVSVSWASNRSGQCLAVRHDGKSFSSELTGDKSLSFFGMQERVSAFGGEMKIFDMLEHGTVIKVRFPVRGVAEIQDPLFAE